MDSNSKTSLTKRAARFSLLDTNHASPVVSQSFSSPVTSLYPELEGSSSEQYNQAHELGADNSETTTRSDPPALEFSQFAAALDEPFDPQKTPKASEFQLGDAPPKRPPIMHRRSLLNEPVSFLSTTSSSRDSSGPPSPITKSEILSSLPDTTRNDTPAWVQSSFSDAMDPATNRLLNARPKAARILGADLQALATEQGGIPISALSSPTYSNPSASSAPGYTQVAPLTAVPEEKSSRPSSPWANGGPFPQPLGAHPTADDKMLRRSATLPAKTSRRPTFLPTPLEAPKTSMSFSRESVLSTPYPGSGFNLQRSVTPNSAPRTGRFEDTPRQGPKPQTSAYKIPLIIRDSRACTSAVGKVELSPSDMEKDSLKDDSTLALAITKEHRRLRGHRILLSARHLVGVRIVLKSHSRDFYTPAAEQSLSPDLNSTQHLLTSEEGRAAAFIASQRAAARATATNASKRHLEESLGFLLKKPSVGRDSHTRSADLRRLIVEAGRPDEHGGPKGTLALEIVEGWHWVKIGVAVGGVVLLSMLATLLWVLVGVNGREIAGQGVVVPVTGYALDSASVAGAGWHGAGSRVTGGATLGVLVLLLGWSWIGLWMGMSWLVD